MKVVIWLMSLSVIVPFVASGCSGTPGKPASGSQAASADADEEKKIQENLNQLSSEDRKLAEQQRYCVESKHRLGEMGPPIKVMVDGQPVFVCCSGCIEDAQKDSKKTLERVKEFKARTADTAPH